MISKKEFNIKYQVLIGGLLGLLLVTGEPPAAASIPLNDKPHNSTENLSASNIQVYGQVPQPNQLQKSYLVFQKLEDQVIGAYYQPRSEFDCFVGTVDEGELHIDFISQPHQISQEYQVSLPDLYSLSEPSQNERRMLNTCSQEWIALQQSNSLSGALQLD